MYDGLLRLRNIQKILKPLFEEIHLEIERPPRDILVVIVQIRIIVNSLVFWLASVVFGKQLCQGRLSAADISCYSYMQSVCEDTKNIL